MSDDIVPGDRVLNDAGHAGAVVSDSHRDLLPGQCLVLWDYQGPTSHPHVADKALLTRMNNFKFGPKRNDHHHRLHRSLR